MTPTISLVQAMTDQELFGKVFASPSFWPWLTVAKLIDGLPLDEREMTLYRECTGRTELPRGPVRRLVMLTGRRGGKDRFESAVAVHRACLAADWRRHMSAGETATVTLLGRDREQAGILRRYAQGLLQAPVLAREVTRETGNVIEFSNGAQLEIGTNDVAAVRGRSAVAVLGSECCYWRTDETSSSSDEEVVSAAEPSMAMTPDGGLMILASSVYRKRGYMHRRWKELWGKNDADDVVWLAPSKVMNPLLPQEVIDKALAEDPEKAGAEFRSIWRSDLSDFVPADVVDGCTDFGTRERAPLPGIRYVAYADAAGGTGEDSFALAVAHAEKDGTVVLDCVREYRPRFIPASVIAELAVLLRSYNNVTTVLGDRFAIGFHADEWKRVGIVYRAADKTTSENYLTMLPLLLAGRARLIDNKVLHSQLSNLERRAYSSGRESVTHPSSMHDDVATASCGALLGAQAAAKRRVQSWAVPIDGKGTVARQFDEQGTVKLVDTRTNQILYDRDLEGISALSHLKNGCIPGPGIANDPNGRAAMDLNHQNKIYRPLRRTP